MVGQPVGQRDDRHRRHVIAPGRKNRAARDKEVGHSSSRVPMGLSMRANCA